ncbi:hypothetical protein [Stenotrophomonas sp. TWI1151]|uniref:hypothetical protein n=1 Tax=Stenotrophomonas sp. TWI1151 TaxID=3136798 RepID=UPI0032089A2E
MKKIRMVAAALLLVSASAHAEVSVSTYKQAVDAGGAVKSTAETYAIGVARGIFWSNAAITHDTGTPMFCMPPKLGTDQDMVLSITNRYIKEHVGKGVVDNDTSIELIVLLALKDTFPCP